MGEVVAFDANTELRTMVAAKTTVGTKLRYLVRACFLIALTPLLTPSIASAVENKISGPPKQSISLGRGAEVIPGKMTAEQHRKELGEIAKRLQLARQRWLERGAVETIGKATILLLMKPGSRGIRRLVVTADPILCLDHDCYVSQGTDTPAEKMSDRRALGISNTIGARARKCSNRTRCVFRNVDLGGETAIIQPIDLRLLRHDRRVPRQIALDRTCQIVGDHVSCLGGLKTGDYAVWVIPEHVAKLAGGSALLEALQNGLTNPFASNASIQ